MLLKIITYAQACMTCTTTTTTSRVHQWRRLSNSLTKDFHRLVIWPGALSCTLPVPGGIMLPAEREFRGVFHFALRDGGTPTSIPMHIMPKSNANIMPKYPGYPPPCRRRFNRGDRKTILNFPEQRNLLQLNVDRGPTNKTRFMSELRWLFWRVSN